MTFKDLIIDLDVNVTLDLEKYGKYLKDVRFSCREYNKGEGLRYSWTASISHKNSGMVGYVHPLRTSNYVQLFKTLKGAKRNFIKRYKEYYEKNVCKLKKKQMPKLKKGKLK